MGLFGDTDSIEVSHLVGGIPESPPSRGAWIEMLCMVIYNKDFCVSPPSRGAWIEIGHDCPMQHSVAGRPPRGGRGLKSQESRC